MNAGFDLMSLLPMVVIFALFYFMMIRPQQKQAAEMRKMIEALQVGDELITSGGLLGRIRAVDAQYLKVEIAKGVEIQCQRNAVQTVLPKGTLKF